MRTTTKPLPVYDIFKDFAEPVYSIGQLTVHYTPTAAMGRPVTFASANDLMKLIKKQYITPEVIYVKEYMYAILFNNRNKVCAVLKLSDGGRSATVFDMGHLFAAALLSNCDRMILVHNHTSGCAKPSRIDNYMTKQVKQAAQMLDMELVDHLIITGNGDFYSYMEDGRLT